MSELAKILREAAGERLVKKQPRCADLFRGAADEIERLTVEVTKLKEGLKEALEWNWCDDDYPENLYYELSQLCKDDDELREILADNILRSQKS